MGCDIHMLMVAHEANTDKYVPVTTQASVNGVSKRFSVPSYFRNYDIFALLCDGVRGMGVSEVNLPERGRFAFEKLSTWAQDVYNCRDQLLTADRSAYDPNPAVQVAEFLQDYYAEDSYCHSQTYVTRDQFRGLLTNLDAHILRWENKRLTLENRRLVERQHGNDTTDLDEDIETFVAIVDDLKGDRAFLSDIFKALDDLYEDQSLAYFGDKSVKLDDWTVLICFDS